jgi:hypothetical protein
MDDLQQIKQSLFPVFKKFFIDVLGKVAFSRFLSLLPINEKMLLVRKSEEDIWINGRSFSILLAATDIHLSPIMEDFGFEFGRYFAEFHRDEILEFENEKFEKIPVHLLASTDISDRVFAKVKWLNYYFKPLNIINDGKILEKEFSLQMIERPVQIPLFCDFVLGVFLTIIDLLKIVDLEIVEDKCIYDGDLYCNYIFNWEEEVPQINFL